MCHFVCAVSCCLLLFLFVRAFPSTLFGGRLAHFELKLLLYWNAAETVAALSNLLYRVDVEAARGLDDGTLEVSMLCKAQGFVMQFGYMSSFLWMLVMAIHAFLVGVRAQRHASKFELVYVALAVVAPAAHAALILELGYFSPTDLWCWISSDRHALAQWLHFYFPWAAIVLITVALRFVTWRTLKERASIEGETGMESAGGMHVRSSVPISSGGVRTDVALSSASSPLARALSRWVWMQQTWLFLFLLLRIPSVVHRAYEQLAPSPVGGVAESETLSVLHAIASPLQGVLPLVVFLLNGRMSRTLKQRWAAWIGNGTTVVPPLTGTADGGTASSGGAGYRSLMEHEAASPNTMAGLQSAAAASNLESVFPPAVWKRIGSQAAHAMMPPTHFYAFPMHTAAASVQSSPSHTLATAASASSSSSASSSIHHPPRSHSVSHPSAPHSLSSLRIFTGSWNMGNEPPPLDPSHPDFASSSVLPSHASDSLSSWLPSGASANAYDLLVVGVQECEYDTVVGRGSWARALCGWNDTRNFVPTAREHWLEVVASVVNRGRDAIHPPSVSAAAPTDLRPFRVVGEASLGHIRLCVLVHPRLLPHVSSVVTSTEASGLGNLWSNKGGVGISLRIGPTLRIAFINVHLAALDGFKNDRNEDVAQIMARLKLRGEVGDDSAAVTQQTHRPSLHSVSSSSHPESMHTSCVCCSELDALQSFDFACFLGDLNYRLVMPHHTSAALALQAPSKKALKKLRLAESKRMVADAFRAGDLASLRPLDELTRLLTQSKLFAGWTEPPLEFYPTYKYKIAGGHKLKARKAAKRPPNGAHSPIASDQYADVRVDGSSSASSSASPPAASVHSAAASSATSYRAPSHDPDLYGAKRVPAWCDRVLYRLSPAYPPESLRVEEYRDVLSVDSSDHKPVRAVFSLDFGIRTAADAMRGASGGSRSGSVHDEEQKDVIGESGRRSADRGSSNVSPNSTALSPPRRRKRTDSDQPESTLTAGSSINAVGAASPPPRDYSRSASASVSPPSRNADDFLASNPGALGLISPASLRLLSSPLGQASHRFQLEFTHLCAYDVLDGYGTPVVEPFLSIVSEVLCGGADAAGECARFHTQVAQPLPGSSEALMSLARSLLSTRSSSAHKRSEPFSLFQSSPTALQCRCIKVAEWDASSVLGSGSAGVALDVSSPPFAEVPVLVTPRSWTYPQMSSATMQLILKDARHLGSDADTIGTACVALREAIVTPAAVTAAHAGAEPTFFIAPIMAQSRYRGFISGFLRVEAMQA